MGFPLGIVGSSEVVAEVSGDDVYFDDFGSYAAGYLGGQGNWVSTEGGTFGVSGGEVWPENPLGGTEVIYYDQPLSADQYAYVTIVKNSGNNSVGPVVRGSATQGYGVGYFKSWGILALVEIDGAANTLAETGIDELETGDRLLVRVTGQSPNIKLTAAIDRGAGFQDVPALTDVSPTVSTNSGRPGLIGNTMDTGNYSSAYHATAWGAGEI